MELLREIWFGVLQLGHFNDGQLAFVVVDVLSSAIASYFILQLLNSRHGWRYIGVVIVVLAVLVGSSLVNLPGLHLLSQAVAIILLIALPVLFADQWHSMFGTTDPATRSAPVLGKLPVVGVAILLALLLVGVSTGVTNRTGTFPDGITLSAANVPDGLSASFGSVRTIQVVISGPRDKWQSLTANSFSATVDLGQQKQGTYTLPVEVTSKVAGVVVVQTNPAQVVVTVEPVIKKTVPIVVSFSGQAGNGLVPDQPDITPATADITGPQSDIAEVSAVVALIKLDGETADINQAVALQAQGPDGQLISTITVNPAQAQVVVPLVKSGDVKDVSVVATITGQPLDGYWIQAISITPPVVAVTGPPAQLQNLTEVNTVPFSVSGLTDNKQQALTLALPSGITSADDTQTVTVNLTIGSTNTTKSITPQLTYANLSNGLVVTATDPTSIAAIVSGASDLLTNLADGAIVINLDLSAYQSAGTYTVPIINSQFTLPSGVSLVSFLPSAISVTLNTK